MKFYYRKYHLIVYYVSCLYSKSYRRAITSYWPSILNDKPNRLQVLYFENKLLENKVNLLINNSLFIKMYDT